MNDIEKIRQCAKACQRQQCEDCPLWGQDYCSNVFFDNVIELCDRLLKAEDDGK